MQQLCISCHICRRQMLWKAKFPVFPSITIPSCSSRIILHRRCLKQPMASAPASHDNHLLLGLHFSLELVPPSSRSIKSCSLVKCDSQSFWLDMFVHFFVSTHGGEAFIRLRVFALAFQYKCQVTWSRLSPKDKTSMKIKCSSFLIWATCRV